MSREKTRVLVAFEEAYLGYGQAIASVIRRRYSSRVDVAVGKVGTLGAELRRFGPHLVICSLPNPAPQNGTFSWVKLSIKPNQASTICLNGRRWESQNPSLEELLSVVEQTEKLVRSARVSGSC